MYMAVEMQLEWNLARAQNTLHFLFLFLYSIFQFHIAAMMA